MGDGQDRALVRGQVLLEPLHALGVEVVGRLVEQQQVRLGQQQLAQRHPAPLTAGEMRHRLSGGGQRSASIACSSCESRSQASAWSISSCSRPISSISSSE